MNRTQRRARIMTRRAMNRRAAKKRDKLGFSNKHPLDQFFEMGTVDQRIRKEKQLRDANLLQRQEQVRKEKLKRKKMLS